MIIHIMFGISPLRDRNYFFIIRIMKKTLLFVFAMVGMLAACNDNNEVKPPSLPQQVWDPGVIELSAGQKDMVKQSNAFALRTALQIHSRHEGESLFFSPISLGCYLGMAANGADEATEGKIRAVLGFDETATTGVVNAYYRTLMTGAEGLDSRCTVETANAFFYSLAKTPLQNFAGHLQQNYQAQLEAVDMDSPVAARRINQWAGEKTHGMIDRIVPEGEPLRCNALLCNAVYMDAPWNRPFDESKTTKEIFTKENGEQEDVWMMHDVRSMLYMETEDFQVVSLPYGNGSWDMRVVLPKNHSSVKDFLEKQTLPSLEEIMEAMMGREWKVTLTMPRFKTESRFTDLADLLFGTDNTSDLSGVPGSFPNILEQEDIQMNLFHTTAIEVSEKGVKAAAATGGMAWVQILEEVEFNANRPFLYAIVEHSTGLIFHMGVYGG